MRDPSESSAGLYGTLLQLIVPTTIIRTCPSAFGPWLFQREIGLIAGVPRPLVAESSGENPHRFSFQACLVRPSPGEMDAAPRSGRDVGSMSPGYRASVPDQPDRTVRAVLVPPNARRIRF